MAVITKYIVVRDGVELDLVFTDKKEAEAYDKMLDAAQELAVLIRQGDLQIDVDDRTIDEISVFLAKNASAVAMILKSVRPIKSASKNADKVLPVDTEPVEEKKSERAPKSKAKNKGN